MKRVRLSSLALFLFVLSAFTNAAPFSEKVAFCQDQVRNRFFSQYEMQKAYNQCMENADRLIQAYEQDKIRQAEQDRINRERWKKQAIEQEKRAIEQERIKLCSKPDYPSESRRLEEEGTVHLRFLIGVEGSVLQSEVEKSSGFSRLDEAARNALSKCQFRPTVVNGVAQERWASIKYTWRLE